MTRTEYVAWWSEAVLSDHEDVLENKATDRHTNDDGAFVFFTHEAEALDAVDEGLVVIEVEMDSDEARGSIAAEDIRDGTKMATPA